MKIYTKKGDSGNTTTLMGVQVRKDSPTILFYGVIDELNAHLGLLASLVSDVRISTDIEHLQNVLFSLPIAFHHPEVSLADEIQWVEKQIDEMESALPPLQSFILPGGTVGASQAHICRTVCRRAESILTISTENVSSSVTLRAYLNRLSDYLFVLARKLNFIDGKAEKTTQNVCR